VKKKPQSLQSTFASVKAKEYGEWGFAFSVHLIQDERGGEGKEGRKLRKGSKQPFPEREPIMTLYILLHCPKRRRMGGDGCGENTEKKKSGENYRETAQTDKLVILTNSAKYQKIRARGMGVFYRIDRKEAKKEGKKGKGKAESTAALSRHTE